MKVMRYSLLSLLAAVAMSCGGAQKNANATPVGESDGSGTAKSADKQGEGSVADDLDVDASGQSTEAGPAEKSRVGKPAEAQAAVTFRLKNTAADDLVLSLDKGWQPVIYAYSGKPPNAKAILMFPTHCTASCSLGEGERCPVCEQPEGVKNIIAAEKREVIAPGKTLDVPWDGQVYVYEKTKAAGKKCDCFKRAAVPPETYTVGACGLRITTSAKSSSKYQCVKLETKFPTDKPQVVELEFGKP